MELEYTNFITVEEYDALRNAVGWTAIPNRQTERGLKNSLFIVCARNNDGKAIAHARVLGDGGYTMLIADVMILPEYQGKGIGRQLLEHVVNFIENSMEAGDRVLVYLAAAKGKEPFYKKFGFIERPNEKYGAGMTQWFPDERN